MKLEIDPTLLHSAYMSIMRLGLENLRRYSLPENYRYLEVEIDHLHNIPSYCQELNVHRHAYYLFSERSLYLERLPDVARFDFEYIVREYQEHWDQLGQQLAPFKDKLLEHEKNLREGTQEKI